MDSSFSYFSLWWHSACCFIMPPPHTHTRSLLGQITYRVKAIDQRSARPWLHFSVESILSGNQYKWRDVRKQILAFACQQYNWLLIFMLRLFASCSRLYVYPICKLILNAIIVTQVCHIMSCKDYCHVSRTNVKHKNNLYEAPSLFRNELMTLINNQLLTQYERISTRRQFGLTKC